MTKRKCTEFVRMEWSRSCNLSAMYCENKKILMSLLLEHGLSNVQA